MHQDRFGQPTTTDSARAVDLYDAAVDLLFALQPGSGPLIDEALTIDPDFALAHCVKARSLAAVGKMEAARRYAALGRDLAAGRSAREHRHAEIIDLALRGESKRALCAVREHADAYPRDAVPLSFALGVYGLLGFGGFNDFHAQQAALLQSVAHAWGDDWWFLAAFGWALVEAGRSETGIPMLDRAMELNPDNANAVHGRVHGITKKAPPPKERRSSTPGYRATTARPCCTDTFPGMAHSSHCSGAISSAPSRSIATLSGHRLPARCPCSPSSTPHPS